MPMLLGRHYICWPLGLDPTLDIWLNFVKRKEIYLLSFFHIFLIKRQLFFVLIFFLEKRPNFFSLLSFYFCICLVHCTGHHLWTPTISILMIYFSISYQMPTFNTNSFGLFLKEDLELNHLLINPPTIHGMGRLGLCNTM